MKERKYRAFFDGKMIYWNDKHDAFYISPTEGAASIVLVRDFTNEPHFIGEGRLEALMDYINLKDKYNNEVYEGDIWEKTTYPRHTIVVEFNKGKFAALAFVWRYLTGYLMIRTFNSIQKIAVLLDKT